MRTTVAAKTAKICLQCAAYATTALKARVAVFCVMCRRHLTSTRRRWSESRCQLYQLVKPREVPYLRILSSTEASMTRTSWL